MARAQLSAPLRRQGLLSGYRAAAALLLALLASPAAPQSASPVPYRSGSAPTDWYRTMSLMDAACRQNASSPSYVSGLLDTRVRISYIVPNITLTDLYSAVQSTDLLVGRNGSRLTGKQYLCTIAVYVYRSPAGDLPYAYIGRPRLTSTWTEAGLGGDPSLEGLLRTVIENCNLSPSRRDQAVDGGPDPLPLPSPSPAPLPLGLSVTSDPYDGLFYNATIAASLSSLSTSPCLNNGGIPGYALTRASPVQVIGSAVAAAPLPIALSPSWKGLILDFTVDLTLPLLGSTRCRAVNNALTVTRSLGRLPALSTSAPPTPEELLAVLTSAGPATVLLPDLVLLQPATALSAEAPLFTCATSASLRLAAAPSPQAMPSVVVITRRGDQGTTVDGGTIGGIIGIVVAAIVVVVLYMKYGRKRAQATLYRVSKRYRAKVDSKRMAAVGGSSGSGFGPADGGGGGAATAALEGSTTGGSSSLLSGEAGAASAAAGGDVTLTMDGLRPQSLVASMSAVGEGGLQAGRGSGPAGPGLASLTPGAVAAAGTVSAAKGAAAGAPGIGVDSGRASGGASGPGRSIADADDVSSSASSKTLVVMPSGELASRSIDGRFMLEGISNPILSAAAGNRASYAITHKGIAGAGGRSSSGSNLPASLFAGLSADPLQRKRNKHRREFAPALGRSGKRRGDGEDDDDDEDDEEEEKAAVKELANLMTGKALTSGAPVATPSSTFSLPAANSRKQVAVVKPGLGAGGGYQNPLSLAALRAEKK